MSGPGVRVARRPAGIVTALISSRERRIVDKMKADTGLEGDADLVRVALYRFAIHLELAIDPEIFHVRAGRRRRPTGT
jgi:hypothetical protein